MIRIEKYHYKLSSKKKNESKQHLKQEYYSVKKKFILTGAPETLFKNTKKTKLN
jgi:hypothetical protein